MVLAVVGLLVEGLVVGLEVRVAVVVVICVVVVMAAVDVGDVVSAGASVIPLIMVPLGKIQGDQVPLFRSGFAAGSRPGKLGFAAVRL